MRGSNRFLSINGKTVKTPIVLASMAGITNAEDVLERAAPGGVAFIGGFSLDDATPEAAREMGEAGRTGFSGGLD